MKLDIEFLEKCIAQRETKSKEQKVVDRILNGDEEPSEVKYVYKRSVVNLYDIVNYKELDIEHIFVRDKFGFTMVLKCKYMVFKYLKEHLTGIMCRNVNQFQIEENMMEKINEISEYLKGDDEKSFTLE